MKKLLPIAFVIVGCSANSAQDGAASSTQTAAATAATKSADLTSTTPGAVDGHLPYAQRGEK